MTQDAWLTVHPYLLSVARFHAQVEKAAASLPSALACLPNWHNYEVDYLAGVPLLQSCGSTIDLRPVGITLEALIAKLGSTALPDELTQEIRDLQVELDQDADASQRAVAKLLDLDTRVSSNCGLLQYLGWTMMSRYLSE